MNQASSPTDLSVLLAKPGRQEDPVIAAIRARAKRAGGTLTELACSCLGAEIDSALIMDEAIHVYRFCRGLKRLPGMGLLRQSAARQHRDILETTNYSEAFFFAMEACKLKRSVPRSFFSSEMFREELRKSLKKIRPLVDAGEVKPMGTVRTLNDLVRLGFVWRARGKRTGKMLYRVADEICSPED